VDPRDLYGLPLDRFVPERTALAKTLRKEGRRLEAAEVAAMRKPSVAAWAVNQLVRTQGRGVAQLYEAGDAARQAQSELLAGRADGKALRDSIARERSAVSQLVEKARGLLSSEGHELTPAMLERVSGTLHAAALDDDVRTQVIDGCLHKELRHVGLGSGADVPPARTARRGSGPPGAPTKAPPTKAPPKAPRAAKGAPTKAAPATAPRAARREEAERAGQLRAARKAEGDARKLADRAARQLASAQERRDKLDGSLREAEEALAAARTYIDETEAEHRRAQDALERLRGDEFGPARRS